MRISGTEGSGEVMDTGAREENTTYDGDICSSSLRNAFSSMSSVVFGIKTFQAYL